MNDENASSISQTRVLEHHRLAEQRKRRPYLKAGALLLLAMLAGAVIGVGGTVLYFRSHRRNPPPKADEVGRFILERMEKTVGLTADERERLRALIVPSMEAVETTRREAFQSMRNEFDDLSDKIDELLGPERARKWDDYKVKQWGDRRSHSQESRERRRHRDGNGQHGHSPERPPPEP